MPVPLDQQMKLVLKINHQADDPSGDSETYYLKTIAYTDALNVGSIICNYRRSLFAQGVRLVYARVSFLGKPRDKRTIPGGPLGPLPQVSPQLLIDNPAEGLMYAYESAAGKWGNRLFRYVPDDMIQDFKLTGPSILPLGASLALSDPLDGGAPLKRIQQSFLRFLITNTRHVQITTPGTPPQGNIEDWVDAVYRRIGVHKVGRPFGLRVGKR